MPADPSPTERVSEQTAWTAGPWEVVTDDDPRGQPAPTYRGLVSTVERSPDRWLSVVASNGYVSPSAWLSNAHLQAAAPELFEALRFGFDLYGYDAPGGPWPVEKRHEFDRLARAALAKARALDASGGDDGAR